MAEMIKCIKCGTEKEESEFYTIKGKIQHTCKECQKKISHKRHQHVFKYNSEIYQSVCWKMGLKYRLYVDDLFIHDVVNAIARDKEFKLTYLESVRKRLIQRSVAIKEENIDSYHLAFDELVGEIKTAREKHSA